MKQKITIKALNPVNKSHIGTIVNTVSKTQGATFTKLDYEDQYNFIFTFELESEADTLDIMVQIRALLKTYGSTILSTNKEQIV